MMGHYYYKQMQEQKKVQKSFINKQKWRQHFRCFQKTRMEVKDKFQVLKIKGFFFFFFLKLSMLYEIFGE